MVALICDQASTNVEAINKLKLETKEMFIRLGDGLQIVNIMCLIMLKKNLIH